MKMLHDKLLQEDGLSLDKALSTARVFGAAQAESKLLTESTGNRAGNTRIHFTRRGVSADRGRKAGAVREGRSNQEQANSDRCGMDSNVSFLTENRTLC